MRDRRRRLPSLDDDKWLDLIRTTQSVQLKWQWTLNHSSTKIRCAPSYWRSEWLDNESETGPVNYGKITNHDQVPDESVWTNSEWHVDHNYSLGEPQNHYYYGDRKAKRPPPQELIHFGTATLSNGWFSCNETVRMISDLSVQRDGRDRNYLLPLILSPCPWIFETNYTCPAGPKINCSN